MDPHASPPLTPYERWVVLLAAGVAILAILASLQLLSAFAAADPVAAPIRSGSVPGCRLAAAPAPGCDAAPPPAPDRTARM